MLITYLFKMISALETVKSPTLASEAASSVWWKIAVGSIVPDLVPPSNPSSGVSPIPGG